MSSKQELCRLDFYTMRGQILCLWVLCLLLSFVYIIFQQGRLQLEIGSRFSNWGIIVEETSKALRGWWRVASPPPTEVTWEPKKLLLFTYARCGSSLTGDIIQHSPGVYYFYEPSRWLHTKLGLTSDDILALAQKDEMMEALFRCNFTTPVMDRLDRVFLAKSNQTRFLAGCYRFPRESPRALTCMLEAQSACRGHAKVVLKVLRYSASSVQRLLTLLPDLAVILLVRDPRGAFWSRRRVFTLPRQENLADYARQQCRRMADDALEMGRLFLQDSHRVRLLRYEDLARRPSAVARNIYRFMGLPWTRRIAELVARQTGDQASHPQDQRDTVSDPAYDRERANQTAASYAGPAASISVRSGVETRAVGESVSIYGGALAQSRVDIAPYGDYRLESDYLAGDADNDWQVVNSSFLGLSSRPEQDRVHATLGPGVIQSRTGKVQAEAVHRQARTRPRAAGRRAERSLEQAEYNRQNPYSVHRDYSARAAMLWRSDITWVKAREIEAECRDFMRAMGYQSYSSPAQLKDLNGLPSTGHFRLAVSLKEAAGVNPDLGAEFDG